FMIGATNKALANRNSAIWSSIPFEIVIVGIRCAINISRRIERHKLMREFIGHRVAYKGNIRIGLEGAQNEVYIGIRRLFFQVAPLLYICFLINDTCFKGSKISRDEGREGVRQIILKSSAGQCCTS